MVFIVIVSARIVSRKAYDRFAYTYSIQGLEMKRFRVPSNKCYKPFNITFPILKSHIFFIM